MTLQPVTTCTNTYIEATREGHPLYLVFVSNPTFVKSTVNARGLSDHDIFITDLNTKAHTKKVLSKKANWTEIHKDLGILHRLHVNEKREDINHLWSTFKSKLFETMDHIIPNKELRLKKPTKLWVRKIQQKKR